MLWAWQSDTAVTDGVAAEVVVGGAVVCAAVNAARARTMVHMGGDMEEIMVDVRSNG